jgi:hypothetical protein
MKRYRELILCIIKIYRLLGSLTLDSNFAVSGNFVVKVTRLEDFDEAITVRAKNLEVNRLHWATASEQCAPT